MTRGIWLAAIAAALAAGPVFAGDDAVPLGRYKPASGGFGGGVPQSPAVSSALPTAAADDTELVHWRRGFYGGWGWGWGGGWGGNAWAWNRGWGWNGGWGWNTWGWNTWGWNGFARPAWGYGYASFYRPGFAVSYYSAPTCWPTYYYTAPAYYGFFPVSGGTAPTVNLNQTRDAVPANPRTDTFRYDGGPSRPIPAPQHVPDRADPVPPRIEPAADGTLSIKYTRPAAAPTKSAYKYPAYGDK